ncbi:ARM repeat-containing protein [Gaertneriomyces semiglobifer]|nr:ARM repeat-containing protein [Gaertneriomyces semiglobifer]
MEALAALTAEVEELLQQIRSGDTTRLQAATAALSSRIYVNPHCIPVLFELASTRPDAGLRQLAAVELRKQIKKQGGASWDALDENLRSIIKQRVLAVVLAEPEKTVRHSFARVVAEIARIELPKEQWGELIAFIYSCCQSETPAHREIGVFVLDTLFDVIADELTDKMPALFSLFSQTLNDPQSLDVRTTTLNALGKVADFIDPQSQEEVKAYRELIPSMVSVLQECLATDQDKAVKGFEVFDNLLVIEAPLLTRHLTQLVQFFVQVAANTDYDDSVRVSALSFLMWTVVYQKNKLVKLNLVQPLIASLFPIAAEKQPDDEDDDRASRVALQVLNSLSTNLAPQQVFPDCMQLIVSYMQNPDPNCRSAAMLAFGVMVDGCADHMRSKIKELLPLLYSGLQDPHPIVRHGACMALGSFADELADEISGEHATLLPIIFNLMHEGDVKLQRSSVNALDAILGGLGDEIKTYLPVLMEKLVLLLSHGPRDLKVQGIVIACIGSAAHSSGDDFVPYAPKVLECLHPYMTTTEAEMLDLRGLAIDSVSAVAEAIGKDLYRAQLEGTMTSVVHGLELDNSRLRECSYTFFSTMARVFEEEFHPYLEVVVRQLLKSCNIEEKDPYAFEQENEDEDIDLGTEEDDHYPGFSLNNAIAEEKECAVDALGQIFAACPTPFLPYVQESVNAFIGMLTHFHEGVRKSAVGSLFLFMLTFYKMSNATKWIPGYPLHVPLHENVDSLAKLAMEGIVTMLDDEEDKSVVAQTFNELNEALKEMGPGALGGRRDAIAETILLVLQKEHKSQLDVEVDDEMGESSGSILRRGANAPAEDDVDQAEYEAVLINAACDLAGGMANALGPDFAPYFQRYFPLIAKYYKKNRPVSDRSMVTGVVAECIAGLKRGITPFTSDVLHLLVKALSDEEDEVRSNAAFGVGLLIEHSEQDLSSYYIQILQLLRPMFDVKSQVNIADNASGAVCRMILRHPAAVPLDQVLPVVLSRLPLRDYEENEPIYTCIITLLRASNAYLLQNMPQLLSIFAQVLSPPANQLKDDTRKALLDILHTLKDQHAADFRNMMASMPGEHASALAVVLSG